MASRWDVVDQQVARALEDDKGKELDQLYYALRSRTVLLYLMFHLRELTRAALPPGRARTRPATGQ